MKTEFKMDKRVKELIRNALRDYRTKSDMNNRALTSDFLLYHILQDEEAILTKYMIKYNHFADLAEEDETFEEDEAFAKETNYESFKESIDETYYWISKFSEEKLKSFYTEKDGTVEYSKEVNEILFYAQELAEEKGLQEIDEEALTVALVTDANAIWDFWWDRNPTYYDELVTYFTEDRYLKGKIREFEDDKIREFQEGKKTNKDKVVYSTSTSDDDAKEMFYCLNDNFSKDETQIIRGRDDEIELAFNILQKMTTRNVALTGEPGVGKSAIAEGIAESIVKGTCPKEFEKMKVLSLDINSLMANTAYVGQIQGKVKKLVKYLEEHQNVIMFIDEFHNIIGAGRSENSSYDVANGIKPLLTSGKARVIGATTEEEYEKWISKDGALKRRFEKIEVKEPKNKDLYKMLQGKIHQLSNYHNVTVNEETFNEVVSYSSGLNFNVANPARTVDLLDTAMVIAKRHDKKELDIESILEVYKQNIKKFKKIKQQDEDYLRKTAYHEVGHFILHEEVGKKFETVTYVSIIPADDYLGVNVFEENEIIFRHTKQEFIEKIAINLAGDIATELRFGEGDAGKSTDLEVATNIARVMILSYGMLEYPLTTLGSISSFSRNHILELNDLSNEQKNDLVKHIDHFLKKGYDLAKAILMENEEKLDILAEALMRKGALSGKIMEELYQGEITLEDLPKSGIELIEQF